MIETLKPYFGGIVWLAVIGLLFYRPKKCACGKEKR